MHTPAALPWICAESVCGLVDIWLNERKRNLAGAFEVCGPVRGTIIVVDDVYTTGSTMDEISRTLKRAGAERVEVLTVARVANESYRAEETEISEGL